MRPAYITPRLTAFGSPDPVASFQISLPIKAEEPVFVNSFMQVILNPAKNLRAF
ncbi:hypothetical protein BACCAP_02045 [Pseudoflavonifractor capillosus ATCC 29799]|uniref:Uncharacterized protein n=1 Tax=Pseudoflavonifractor capillosus ATCC 29799 TaxID=411467 RepID=A6NV11_9FIRM|nr:hypothetical protein BACCAP_02045 [Pseudoflavonifractor capillosus ATCC 29799]